PTLLLPLVRRDQQVPDAQGVVRGDRERQRAVDRRDLLDDQRRGVAAESRAAVALRDLHAEEPHGPELGYELVWERAAKVAVGGAGRDLAREEVAQWPEDRSLVC